MHSVIKSNLLQLSECRNRKRCREGVRGDRGLRENSGSAIFDLANWFFFRFLLLGGFSFRFLLLLLLFAHLTDVDWIRICTPHKYL